MLIIYGESYDRIEFDGDIFDEVDCWKEDEDDSPDFILCSDGTVLEFRYNRLWQFKPVFKGARFIKIHPCFEEYATGYSDQVYFESGVEWCAVVTDSADKQKVLDILSKKGSDWIVHGVGILFVLDSDMVFKDSGVLKMKYKYEFVDDRANEILEYFDKDFVSAAVENQMNNTCSVVNIDNLEGISVTIDKKLIKKVPLYNPDGWNPYPAVKPPKEDKYIVQIKVDYVEEDYSLDLIHWHGDNWSSDVVAFRELPPPCDPKELKND